MILPVSDHNSCINCSLHRDSKRQETVHRDSRLSTVLVSIKVNCRKRQKMMRWSGFTLVSASVLCTIPLLILLKSQELPSCSSQPPSQGVQGDYKVGRSRDRSWSRSILELPYLFWAHLLAMLASYSNLQKSAVPLVLLRCWGPAPSLASLPHLLLQFLWGAALHSTGSHFVQCTIQCTVYSVLYTVYCVQC